MPKPRQPGGVPVWVSGRSTNRRVLDRIARFGSGWIPWGDDAVDPAPGIARIREAMAAAGRDDDPLQVVGTLPRDLSEVPALVAAGVTDFRSRRPLPDDPAAVEDDLADLVQQFRAVV
jgi:alkanesulfonate monooxygenase SsuD/methylene tetrahydromethanopterin reductase-like flavin-dependent oxidoreductase (luciferase family)